MVIEETKHFAGRSALEEGGEDEVQSFLDFEIGLFHNSAIVPANEPNWQLQGQVTPLCFVQKTCRHPCPNGVQLQFRELAFQSQQKATVGRTRIVNTVAICNQAPFVATDVEQGVPIGAIA
jgi:hypothetical protein